MTEPIGVLVMAYGGPENLGEVERYLLDVRGYRATPAHVVDEVRRRYARIGGGSPILARTRAQADAVAAVLARRNGALWDVEVGMRHWHPYIGDALHRLAQRGVRRAVGLVMAPHYSRLSIGAYFSEVEAAQSDVQVAPIESWQVAPGYIRALAERVRDALARLPDDERATAPVIFTAHSLPERILAWHDPYPAQLAQTVDAVRAELGERERGERRPWRFAYQSAAMTNEPWLGPDVEAVLEQFAAGGARAVVVAPVGFVSEHVEILYDLDCELMERADELGVRLERIEMLNDHPLMVESLADLVTAAARRAGWR